MMTCCMLVHTLLYYYHLVISSKGLSLWHQSFPCSWTWICLRFFSACTSNKVTKSTLSTGVHLFRYFLSQMLHKFFWFFLLTVACPVVKPNKLKFKLKLFSAGTVLKLLSPFVPVDLEFLASYLPMIGVPRTRCLLLLGGVCQFPTLFEVSSSWPTPQAPAWTPRFARGPLQAAEVSVNC